MAASSPSSVKSLEELLTLNEARMSAFRARPFFSILEEAVLADPGKRNVLLACMQRFSSNFQTLLFIRQGLCADPRYQGVFLQHLTEEFGHDALLAKRDNPESIQDTLFEALLAWFNYQMLILDNAERAALMHLVLEAAGDHIHGLASPKLGKHVESSYFETHAELDASHAALGVDLLKGHGVATYERLGHVVASGWDMMEAVLERVRQLVTKQA